jgi:hypothetical protein
MSDSMTSSARVRSQLISALTLDLVGPTPEILAQLELDGRTQEAAELKAELLDRPPNRWYQSGFLIPSETSLGDRADDAADDELEFPRFRGQVLELHTNDCRGRRKALLVIDWTEETDR